jgi:hypothetical protein
MNAVLYTFMATDTLHMQVGKLYRILNIKDLCSDVLVLTCTYIFYLGRTNTGIRN